MRRSPSEIRPEHRVVLIKIGRSMPADGNEDELLEATSKWWVVAPARRTKGKAGPEFALAVNKGRVVAAYRIDKWVPAPDGRRWGFVGRRARDLDELYGDLDVTGYFPPGAANPLRYVNCAAAGRSTDATSELAEIQRMELDEVAAALLKEPLTHLMLGHRELFHSNLLAWFFDALQDAADQVFGPLSAGPSAHIEPKRQVSREKGNLDLCLRWPGRRPVLIENKVFSLPDERQLHDYGKSRLFGGAEPCCWLLSLTDPSWPDDRKQIGRREWRWLSYRDLADRIRRSLPARRSYKVETMRRYARVVELLAELAAGAVVGDGTELVALSSDIRTAVGDDRLVAAIAKLRARSVADRVRQALEEAGVRNLEVEAGLSHSLPLNSWFGDLPGAKGARAGWQLQEDQFRLAIITKERSRSAAGRRRRFAFARAHEDHFDFSSLDAILETESSPRMPTAGSRNPDGFCRFDPDFVYRYKSVPNITVEQLERAAVEIARRVGADRPARRAKRSPR